MRNVSHHGKIVQAYRASRLGISQEELGKRVGKSRRTIVTIEQMAYIDEVRLRRTLAWALQIPPELLDLPDDTLPQVPIFHPLETPSVAQSEHLSRTVFDTFTDNLRMRFHLYYLGSSLSAAEYLESHIEMLTQRAHASRAKDLPSFLRLLSHNYQLKGLIARDQLGYEEAEQSFQQASLFAQQAECAALAALAMGRQAVLYVMQGRDPDAGLLYETAREMTKHSPVALRAYLAIGHAEAQGKLGDEKCLLSLTEARSLTQRIDTEDDDLLLFHSTRCSDRAVEDCWAQCHAFIGKPVIAIEHYDKLERKLDLSMTRMRARLGIQYAEALYAAKDLSCCFYITEGVKLAQTTHSCYNLHRAMALAHKMRSQHPHDSRVKDMFKSF
ncbi:MAG: hypothetical protein JO202_08030 [Ktedonobacteraceae bacterium]|nr:hypothetical protein [Ktedonobacteraceae bacterium]